MEKHFKKTYVCNRCKRCDFANGHALGGHKKYCGKSEYEHVKKKQKNNINKKRKRNLIQFDNKKIDELINFKNYSMHDNSSEYFLIDEIEKNCDIFDNESYPFNYNQVNDNEYYD